MDEMNDDIQEEEEVREIFSVVFHFAIWLKWIKKNRYRARFDLLQFELEVVQFPKKVWDFYVLSSEFELRI
jgi:hypothetical protein